MSLTVAECESYCCCLFATRGRGADELKTGTHVRLAAECWLDSRLFASNVRAYLFHIPFCCAVHNMLVPRQISVDSRSSKRADVVQTRMRRNECANRIDDGNRNSSRLPTFAAFFSNSTSPFSSNDRIFSLHIGSVDPSNLPAFESCTHMRFIHVCHIKLNENRERTKGKMKNLITFEHAKMNFTPSGSLKFHRKCVNVYYRFHSA